MSALLPGPNIGDVQRRQSDSFWVRDEGTSALSKQTTESQVSVHFWVLFK